MPLARPVFQSFDEEQRAYIAALLREGMASGRFRQEDADLLAAALLAALRGLTDAFMFNAQDSLEQGTDILMTTLFQGLLQREVSS